ncbi:hypothetical protein [Nonomuraea rhizosphaerae]|uniref:hypothetical protein n=1 Tax=Nonomuraea rhizosphaerae TaxID=2665663 RepID=UPI001C5FE4B8|nr:hypothetical protein [Nonomuraea rhizosphaerae]
MEDEDAAGWLWHEADPGDWSGEALKPLAEGRGHLMPVAEHERRHTGEREYRGLVVPLTCGPGPDGFRQVAGRIEGALGPASSAGGPGEVDGEALAAHLVEVLRTEKVSSIRKLGRHVSGPENAHTVLFGLGF